MHNSGRPLSFIAVALLLLTLLGCGRSSMQAGDDAQPAQSVSGSQLLSDLDKLEVSPQLKGALKQALDITPGSNFVAHPPTGPHSTVTDLTLAILPDGSSGLQWTYVNPGDYNFDGQVNLHDLVNLGAFLGVVKGGEGWDKAQYVDGDGNGAITIADITPIAANFMGTVTAWQIDKASGTDQPFAPVGQVPWSEGKPLGDLQPPQFVVAAPVLDGNPARVCPLGPDGNSGPESQLMQPVVLRPNVRIVSAEPAAQLRLLDRTGLHLNFELDGEETIAAGDILFNRDPLDGFLLRANDIVASGKQIRVECGPAELSDLVQRGVVYLPFVPALPTQGAPSSPLVKWPDYQIDLQGNCAQSGLMGVVRICLDPSGVTYVDASAQVHDFQGGASIQLTGNNHGLTVPGPSPAEFYERPLTGSSSYDLSDPAQDHTLIPFRLTYQYLAGLKTEGEIDGDYNLGITGTRTLEEGDPIDLLLQRTLDLSSGEWTSNDQLGHVAVQPYGMPSLAGTGNFTVEPYVRTELRIECFPASDETQPVDDIRVDIQMNLAQSNTRTDTPSSGYDFTQTARITADYSIDLTKLGVPAATSALSSESTEGNYSGFIPDPPPAVTRTVSGHIFDGSLALQGVEVTVRDSGTSEVLGSAVTDDQGAYSVAGLPDGAVVEVRPALEGYTFSPPNYELTLDADKTADFAASPAAVQTYGVSGYLIDSDGMVPMVGAVVQLYGPGGAVFLRQTETDSNGHYSFANVDPFSTVRVVPEMEGYGFTPSYAEFTVTGELGQDFTGFAGSGP